MINGLEGIPGSGKSYEAVVFHVLPALQKGRLVITNLPLLVDMFAALNPDYRALIQLRRSPAPVLGTWDPERMREDDKGNVTGNAFELWPDGVEPEETNQPGATSLREMIELTGNRRKKNRPSVFGSVWDYYTEWKHPKTGHGPLFIIDEAHNPLPRIGTDQDVIDWYKLHRHFNVDVLLCDQSFREVSPSIAGLLAMLIKVRKADILGRKDAYIRKVQGGYRGAVISQEERPYQAQFFPLYKSHTQGNSVVESTAQDVAPLAVKLRQFTRGFWIFTLLFSLGVGWWIYNRKASKPSKPTVTRTVSAGPPPAVPGAPAPQPKYVAEADSPAIHNAAPEAAPVVDLEPLSGKMIHITGWLKGPKGTIYTFAVSGGGIRQFNVLAADLMASGYTWKPLGECMGYLTFEQKTRAVTCDAPALADGRENAPVVMDAGSGKRSDGSGKT